ncbi:hypothetical protein T261_0495 [Streptomyces lydicus]|nr:hypothetical protein T261_0495 [Streptomyces lydicus]
MFRRRGRREPEGTGKLFNSASWNQCFALWKERRASRSARQGDTGAGWLAGGRTAVPRATRPGHGWRIGERPAQGP